MKTVSRHKSVRQKAGAALGAAMIALIPWASAPALEDTENEQDTRVGHYSSEAGEEGFVLDRRGELARVKFADSEEILLLEMVPGPNGNTILKDECGATVLRLTPFGGATVYEQEAEKGMAFGRTVAAQPLELGPRNRFEVQAEADMRISTFNGVYGLDLQYEADWGTGDQISIGNATLGDAIENAVTALERLAIDPIGLEILSERVRRLTFEVSGVKQIGLQGDNLVIFYVQDQGLEGRPSSASITCFLENNL